MRAILHWTVAITVLVTGRVWPETAGWKMSGDSYCPSTNTAVVVAGASRIICEAVGCRIELPGANAAVQAGAPALPFYTILVPLSPGCSLQARFAGGEYSETNTVDLLPAASLAPVIDMDGVLRLPPEQTVDDSIYSKDEWWPRSLVGVETAWQGHQQWARLWCTPFHYNPVRRILRIYSRVDVQVEWFKTSPSQ